MISCMFHENITPPNPVKMVYYEKTSNFLIKKYSTCVHIFKNYLHHIKDLN